MPDDSFSISQLKNDFVLVELERPERGNLKWLCLLCEKLFRIPERLQSHHLTDKEHRRKLFELDEGECADFLRKKQEIEAWKVTPVRNGGADAVPIRPNVRGRQQELPPIVPLGEHVPSPPRAPRQGTQHRPFSPRAAFLSPVTQPASRPAAQDPPRLRAQGTSFAIIRPNLPPSSSSAPPATSGLHSVNIDGTPVTATNATDGDPDADRLRRHRSQQKKRNTLRHSSEDPEESSEEGKRRRQQEPCCSEGDSGRALANFQLTASTSTPNGGSLPGPASTSSNDPPTVPGAIFNSSGPAVSAVAPSPALRQGRSWSDCVGLTAVHRARASYSTDIKQLMKGPIHAHLNKVSAMCQYFLWKLAAVCPPQQDTLNKIVKFFQEWTDKVNCMRSQQLRDKTSVDPEKLRKLGTHREIFAQFLRAAPLEEEDRKKGDNWLELLDSFLDQASIVGEDLHWNQKPPTEDPIEINDESDEESLPSGVSSTPTSEAVSVNLGNDKDLCLSANGSLAKPSQPAQVLSGSEDDMSGAAQAIITSASPVETPTRSLSRSSTSSQVVYSDLSNDRCLLLSQKVSTTAESSARAPARSQDVSAEAGLFASSLPLRNPMQSHSKSSSSCQVVCIDLSDDDEDVFVLPTAGVSSVADPSARRSSRLSGSQNVLIDAPLAVSASSSPRPQVSAPRQRLPSSADYHVNGQQSKLSAVADGESDASTISGTQDRHLQLVTNEDSIKSEFDEKKPLLHGCPVKELDAVPVEILGVRVRDHLTPRWNVLGQIEDSGVQRQAILQELSWKCVPLKQLLPSGQLLGEHILEAMGL